MLGLHSAVCVAADLMPTESPIDPNETHNDAPPAPKTPSRLGRFPGRHQRRSLRSQAMDPDSCLQGALHSQPIDYIERVLVRCPMDGWDF
jgi:hypothetical protein